MTAFKLQTTVEVVRQSTRTTVVTAGQIRAATFARLTGSVPANADEALLVRIEQINASPEGTAAVEASPLFRVVSTKLAAGFVIVATDSGEEIELVSEDGQDEISVDISGRVTNLMIAGVNQRPSVRPRLSDDEKAERKAAKEAKKAEREALIAAGQTPRRGRPAKAKPEVVQVQ